MNPKLGLVVWAAALALCVQVGRASPSSKCISDFLLITTAQSDLDKITAIWGCCNTPEHYTYQISDMISKLRNLRVLGGNNVFAQGCIFTGTIPDLSKNTKLEFM
jgi:hypothetical protein